MESVNIQKNRYFTTSMIVKTAIFAALSFVFYMFPKITLPIFPVFLELNFSDIPALIGGFVLGPATGVIIVAVKVVLKLPFSTTSGIGELADLIIGIAFVLPAAFMYKQKKSLVRAIAGLLAGAFASTLAAILANIIIIVPFYVNVAFGGNMAIIVDMCKAFIPSVTQQNFYLPYSLYIILPFNIIRCLFAGLLTFLLYKRISVIFRKF